MSNTISDRIQTRMNDLELRQADLVKATGAGRTTVSNWVNGHTSPTGEFPSLLAKVLKVDTNWLLTGEGHGSQEDHLEFLYEFMEGRSKREQDFLFEITKTDPNGPFSYPDFANKVRDLLGVLGLPPRIRENFLEGTDPSVLFNSESTATSNLTNSKSHKISIELYEIKICNDESDKNFYFEPVGKNISFTKSFFSKYCRNSEHCLMLYASNDSMAPYIQSRDFVMIDKSITQPKDGEVYAVWFEGELMLKRIFKEAGGALRLTSDNEKYYDKVVTVNTEVDFKILGEQFYRCG